MPLRRGCIDLSDSVWTILGPWPPTGSRNTSRTTLAKWPNLTKELCIRVVEAPIRVERQETNRFRFWRAAPELEGKFVRVITLEDKVTIHNAFLDLDLDRRFKP